MLWLTLLIACGPTSDDDVAAGEDDSGSPVETPGTSTADSDGDGVPDVDDCDPNDPDVRPGVPDRCNEIDDDCDDQVDEEDYDADDDGADSLVLCGDVRDDDELDCDD